MYQSGVEDPVYYKAVDKNGNKVSFYDDNGNEIKYTVIILRACLNVVLHPPQSRCHL